MVGSKPNAYLSEEARLEAQRRMLAERYGLLSDDSDDNDSADEQPPAQSGANGLSNATTNGNGTAASAQENGQPPPNPSSTVPHMAVEEPASSEAATYGEGSSVHDGDLSTILSQDDVAAGDAVVPVTEEREDLPMGTADGRTPGWPGVELLDSSGRIHAIFEYSSPAQGETVPSRDLRMTPITVYASQFVEKHRRKIAVNDQIITYAVGGHVRAILRNSTVRALLKGHDSAVADIEFLGSEKRLDETRHDSISVLGSVAEDGSVYVWKIVRNDADENNTLGVADAIRFEHPDIAEGRSYNRISFRPGSSIIAVKGIGVAMILMDPESPDVRLVELVKMNEKMMVRDKFLRAQKESDASPDKDVTTPIDSAAWLSERMVATSRCGKVYLWNIDGTLASCITKLPRAKATKVTALHALNHEALLLESEYGQELEVWVAAGFAPDVDTASLVLHQTIKFPNANPSSFYSVTSVDPSAELVFMSNVKGTSFLVLHFNPIAKAFDAITEVPVKQSILSFCMTRNTKKNAPPAAGSEVINTSAYEEVGLWCVQPRGISLFHLPAGDCAPRSNVKPEIFPKPTQRTIMKRAERRRPTSRLHASISTGLESGQGGLFSVGPSRNVANSGRSEPVAPISAGNQGRGLAAPVTTSPDETAGQNASLESSKMSGPSSSSSVPVVPSTHVQGLSSETSEPGPNSDQIADAILQAAKKAVESFEQGAGQRVSAEKAKMERLVENVSNSAKANLERFVNSSMKKVLVETIIPGMSKIVADVRAEMKSSRVDPKVTTEYFETALEKSSINESFSNACREMEKQVTASVTQSMSSKYELLIVPTIGSLNEAAEDLSGSVKMLQQKISEIKIEAPQPVVVEIGPEDIRKTIEEEIERGNVDGAFQTALDKEDLSLVTWLCAKFDCSTFFESHTLSQTSLLSLAQQLGHGLGEGMFGLKVEWLRELMLVLEPESEEIVDVAQPAINQLLENVADLRKKKAVLDEHGGLEKSLKTLGRLIASHLPN